MPMMGDLLQDVLAKRESGTLSSEKQVQPAGQNGPSQSRRAGGATAARVPWCDSY